MPFMVSEAARGTARAECVCFEETSSQHPDPKQGRPRAAHRGQLPAESQHADMRTRGMGPPKVVQPHLPQGPKYLLILIPVQSSPYEAKGPTAQWAQRTVLVRVCTLTGCQPLQLSCLGGLLKPRSASEHLCG